MWNGSSGFRDIHAPSSVRKYLYKIFLLIQTVNLVSGVTTKKCIKFLIIQACLRHLCIQASREVWASSAGFEPAISCLKWDLCPSNPDAISEAGLDDVPPHYPINSYSPSTLILVPLTSMPKICVTDYSL